MPTKRLKMDVIRDDGGTQTRAELRPDIIDDYAEAMNAGAEFPPIDVFWDEAGHYWLADGFHRYQAACRCELESISANVHKGELRDAIWFALQANTKNGIRRTNADKRRCVTLALSDKEWSVMSDHAIADHVGVSQPFVSQVRGELITVISCDPPKRKGKDGKKRKVKPKPKKKAAKKQSAPPADPDVAEAARLMDRIDERGEALETLTRLIDQLDGLGLAEELNDHTEAIRDRLVE